MWLINAQDLTLKEITDPSSVRYAILSHTWGDDEVTFQDFSDLDPNKSRHKAGFTKIENSCRLALDRGLQYVWIDTCCINKSSSAELSEAINSMFTWYKQSTVCFVFLYDLPTLDGVDSIPTLRPECRWFTRGWTLQELIAPDHVEFFDSQWAKRSTKAACLDALASITGISLPVLRSSKNLRQTPVAVKMSWAAERKTKRVEDRAYSLLGIFDINMPMIYGEGEKAFRRLQEEIARETNDLSLFAWRGAAAGETGFQRYRGIFARSPAEFDICSAVSRSNNRHESEQEFSITNKGVRIEARLWPDGEDTYLMYLGFSMQDGKPVCISLKRTVDGFIRSAPWSLSYNQIINDVEKLRDNFTVYIRKDIDLHQSLSLQKRMHRAFSVAAALPEVFRLECLEPIPEYLWDRLHTTFISNEPEKSFAANLHMRVHISNDDFNQSFNLVLTMGWVRTHQKAFAVLYSTEDSDDIPQRTVKHVVPQKFPQLVRGDLDWARSQEDTFEAALSELCATSEFQANEVQFIHEKTMIVHRGVRKASAYVVLFKLEFETQELDDNIVRYHVRLLGQLSKVEGRNAVVDARLYLPRTGAALR